MIFTDTTALTRAYADVLAPKPVLSVSQWADQKRVLSGKAASEPGRWHTARTPYLREVLDALSRDCDVHEVVFWSGTQLGKTEACLNFLGYIIGHDAGPVLFVQPTLDMAKRFSKQRVASMIEATPALRERIKPVRSRDSGNTLLEKEFDNGILIITGANAAAGLRSMPARDVIFDEIDAYPLSLGAEGDPISLGEKRQDNFPTWRRLKTSTCTIKGESRIEQAYAASDRRRYFVPCPHCVYPQVLRWKNIEWLDGRPETVRYRCEACATLIEETHKTEMLDAGEWIAEAPQSPIRGYWINSLYSPLGWLSWEKIVREYLEAKVAQDAGDSTLMQVWQNTRLAETWELTGERIGEHELQQRAEDYELRTVPTGVLVLTASVDVQGDRLELMICGWGRGEECWILDYQKIYGDPAEDHVWTELDSILTTPLRIDNDHVMRISATAVDHGGHHSTTVEAFTRARTGRNVIAVKGQSQEGKPILGPPHERDTTWKGKKLKYGARIWPIGVDTAKHALHERLGLKTAGPGFVHTSKALDDEFFRGLTAEQLVTRFVRGRPKKVWHLPRGRRNEPLDLWVYAYAAAAYVGITRWKRDDVRWRRLEAALAKPKATVETDERKEEPQPPERARQQQTRPDWLHFRQRRRSNWIGRS